MALDASNLPTPVARQLREFYRRKRLYELLRVVLSVVTVCLLCALVVMHLDRFLFLEPSTRLLLTRAVHLVGILFAVVLFAGFLLRRISARRLAYELEDRLPPDAAERYVTLAELADTPESANLSDVSRSLLEQLRCEATDYSGRFRAKRLVRDRRLKLLTGAALAVVALYGLLLFPAEYQLPLMVQRFVDPRANLPKPSFVRIEVTPTEAVIGKGGEIVIQARTHGEMPAIVKWLFDFFGAAPDRCYFIFQGGPTDAVEMNRIQRNLFVFSRADLQDSFQFRVRCADGQTAVHLADVVTQPEITNPNIAITPPDYTKLPKRTVQDIQGAVQLYPGSHVSLEFVTDQPVVERRIRVSGEETIEPEWDVAARTGRYGFEFQDDLELAVEVVDDRGFQNVDSVRLVLRGLQDRKPVIALNHPTGDTASVPGELVPLEFEVEDDLGVREIVVQYVLNPEQSADSPIKEIPVDLPGTQENESQPKKVTISTMLDLDKIGAVPADNLQVLIRARDAAGNDGQSRAIGIRIEAFARGEIERRRLQILDFLARALRTAAAGGVPDDTASIDTAAYDRILESADRISLELNTAPSLASVLDRLELEIHFTDEPQYKEDVRMISGIVCEAAITASEEQRREILNELGEETLSELTVYRRLKNLTWRVFGLGYELDSVRDKIQDIQSHRQSVLQTRRELAADYPAGMIRAVQKDGPYQDLLKRKADIRQKVGQIQRKIRDENEGGRPPFSNPGGPPRVQPPPRRGQDSPAVRELRAELSDLAAETSKLDKDLENRLTAIRKQAASDDPDIVAKLNRQLGRETLARAASRAVSTAITKQVPAKEAALEVATKLLDSADNGADPLAEALNRRTALYLATVESVGDTLLTLAEAEKALDEQACRQAQGELVSTVYLIARKEDSLTRRALACDRVSEQLRTLQGLLVPLLPQYATIEQQARGKLQEEFEATRNRVVSGSREQPEKATLWQAEDWLRSDMGMMGLNPYAPLWPYVRDLELLERRVRGAGDVSADDTPGLPASARREWWQLQTLAFDRRLARVTAMDRIAATEKALASHLIGLEASLALGPDIAVNPPSFYAEKVETFDSAESEQTPPRHLLELCPVHAQALPEEDPGVVAEPPVQRWLVSRDPVASLVETANTMQARESVFEDLRTSLAASQNPAGDITQLLERTRRDLDRIEELVMLLRLRLAYAPASVLELEAQEVLFLMLRQSLGRYGVRTSRAVTSLEAISRKTLSAADLTRATTDLTALGGQHRALREDIHQSAARLRDGDLVDEETREKYPLFDTFRRTETLVQAARQSLATEKPAAVAEQFLAEFPEAASSFLVSRRGTLEDVRDQLERCRRELRAKSPDAAAYRSALDKARQSLTDFRTVLALLAVAQSEESTEETRDPKRERGTSGVPTQLVASLESLDGRVRNLDSDLDTAAATEIRARLFALGEIVQTLERTFGVLDVAARQTGLPSTKFTGGPDNTWVDANRKSANNTRSRIEGLGHYANQQVVRGVLGGLQEPGDTVTSTPAIAWSRLLYRLVRAPLTGPVVIRTGRGDEGAPAEPLVAWLLEELDEAQNEARRKGNLKHYSESTVEWIRSMKDFLRY